ncbi:hypothetical protein KXR94_06420 [Stutzerimonas stutzeri]
MQQKWMDRPAPDEDIFDRALESSSNFLRRHISMILKIAPPLFGFGMFVLYFYRNHFYPSFDLFQFSSLLIAAAAIGFIIIGLLVVLLFLPGPWIFGQFLDLRIIKDELRYSRPYLDHQLGWWALKLGGLVFALPFLTCALGLLSILVLAPPLFTISVLVVPILVTLLFGLIIQAVFMLPKFSFVRYMWAADVGVMVVGVLVTYTLGQSAPIIEGFQIGAWKWVVYVAAVLGVSGIAALCSFAFIAGWNPALHFSAFFAMFIAGYSGLLTTLPDKAVQALGLGNYLAEAVLLEPNYCEAPIEQLPMDASCVMKDVHIVWSLGETLVLRSADNRVVQIPSKFVRAIIKPAQ